MPVRFTENERRYIEAAKDQEYRDTLRAPAEPALSAFCRAGSFERAVRILGMTLAEFEAKDRRK